MIINPGLIRGKPASLNQLIGLQQISPKLAFSRAQSGGVIATQIGADNTTWAEVGADVPRFAGTALRLMNEGQRINGIPNPRAEGGTIGVIGSGGVVPTNWIMDTTTGLTREYLGPVTVNGLPGARFRWSGTNSSGSTGFPGPQILPDLLFAAVAGDVGRSSFFLRLQAGSLSGVTQVRSRVRVSGSAQDNFLVVTPTGTLTRIVHPALTATAGATFWRSSLVFDVANGASIDFTIDIVGAQFEVGGQISSPILPPVGTPGASTRGADLATSSLASLGINSTGACTVLWSGMIPQASPSTGAQNILQIDDGTSTNRAIMRVATGGSIVAINRVTAGVAAGDNAIGTMTAGTPFRAGFVLDGSGRVAGSFNGGAVVAITGAPTSGLATLRLGTDSGGGTAMFGETNVLRVLARPVSDGALQALVAALPV